MANLYDEVPYRTFPRRQTHPDRLATLAALFGMTPAPVTQCRVLEIGCGSGGNLLPMAYALPRSTFVGIDLAASPVAAAQESAGALGLGNVELRVCDLSDLSAADGEFDYIFAHGLYSWIPEEARDALLERCRALLAPQGVAFVSYNAFPGQHERLMLREMLLYRGDSVESARAFLKTIAHEEAAALAESPDDILFHDILAPVNQAVYFHEFAAHARRHRLQYLGEADLHEMFDEQGRLQDEAGEQELDFRKLRRFRQTLLCREEIQLTRRIEPQQMDSFWFSQNPHGRRIAGSDSGVEAVAQALEDMYPLPVGFEELVAYAGSGEGLREILTSVVAAGCADPHVYAFPCGEASEQPRASSYARFEARTSDVVTSLCQVPVRLTAGQRNLLLELDGTCRVRGKSREVAEWLAGMALLEG